MILIHRIFNKGFFIAVLIVIIPFITPGNYVISIMCFVAIYGALSLGMGILLEQAGLFSLAHPVWFGIGAYTTGILAKNNVPPIIAIVCAAFFIAFLAYIIGAPLLRLKGYYMACATFAIMIVTDISIPQMGSLTGGHDGLTDIPPLSVAGFVFNGDFSFYYLSWGLCLLTLWFINNLMNSRPGRGIKAFNSSETAGKSAGVNVTRYKLQIFVITAVMASLAGSVFCFYLRYVSALMFGFPMLVELITMIIVGGGKTLWGPLLGSFVILWFRELIHAILGKIFPYMNSQVDATFFGIIIVVILIFMPDGLAGCFKQLLTTGKKFYGHFSKT